jgi:hypothetical protein
MVFIVDYLDVVQTLESGTQEIEYATAAGCHGGFRAAQRDRRSRASRGRAFTIL